MVYDSIRSHKFCTNSCQQHLMWLKITFFGRTSVFLSLTSQIWCPINGNGVSLTNLHPESPPGLRCGRGHSVRMGWWSIWKAKHVGNAGRKAGLNDYFLVVGEGGVWNEMRANIGGAFQQMPQSERNMPSLSVKSPLRQRFMCPLYDSPP